MIVSSVLFVMSFNYGEVCAKYVCLFVVYVSQAHSGSSQPAAHLEQTSRQRARHQENQRRKPRRAFQGALQVSSGGT